MFDSQRKRPPRVRMTNTARMVFEEVKKQAREDAKSKNAGETIVITFDDPHQETNREQIEAKLVRNPPRKLILKSIQGNKFTFVKIR